VIHWNDWPSLPDGDFGIDWDSQQANGLVFWLPFQHIPGLVVDLVRGFSFTGSATKPSAVTTVERSRAYSFAGANYWETTDRVIPALPFTISVWYKVPAASLASNMYMIGSSYYNGGSSGDYYALRLLQSKVTAGVYQSGITGQNAQAAINSTANVWQLAVVVFANIALRTAYVNGANPGSNTVSIVPANMSRFAIGTLRRSDNPAVYYTGLFSDLRVYNRALTPVDVWQMYDPATRCDLYLQK
jgi:hypothetical protein